MAIPGWDREDLHFVAGLLDVAALLFQIISQRYERGAIIVTTNKAYKHRPAIFNNDAGIAAAILDSLLHCAETVVLEGKSHRMEDPTGRRTCRLNPQRRRGPDQPSAALSLHR
jgi:hypothetical protein